jgi:enoyl-CoA hydratase
VTLGGGIGLGAHVSHRIVTERSRLGMPEVTIGFVPDVGGTFLLSRAPGELGTHLALTGASIGAGDALLAGLADTLVPSERLPELLELLETRGPDDAIAAVRGGGGLDALDQHPGLAADREWIDAAYAGDSVPSILENLRRSGRGDVADLIATKSPLALAVTLASLRRARRETTLEQALDREFRVSVRFLAEPDFAEGVRAQLVDKDRSPRWNPPTFDQIDDARIEAFYAPLERGD